MFLISDVPVEVLFHPKLARPMKNLIRFVRSIRLERMEDVLQSDVFEPRHQQVHVVWHHNPRKQLVTRAIKLQERVLDHRRYRHLLQ